jgi:hypothetical protein
MNNLDYFLSGKTFGYINQILGTGEKNMTDFVFLGNPPQMESHDVIEMSDEVARYDIVAFERVGPKKIAMRVVKPEEYTDFPETFYQIDLGEQEGTYQLRQVQMRFWPW